MSYVRDGPTSTRPESSALILGFLSMFFGIKILKMELLRKIVKTRLEKEIKQQIEMRMYNNIKICSADS